MAMTVQRPKRSKLASVLSGSASGALVSACVQPLDVLRTRMQGDVAHGVFRGTVQTMKAIVAEGGVRTLWMGTQPTVIRLAVGSGLHFFFLETIKPLLERQQPDGSSRMTAWGAALTGGLSRAAAACISCPITVVKTRMEYSGAGGHRYTSTLQALTTIARQDGIRGMYRGLGPTVLSNAPFSALYYMFYTRLQERLKTTERPTMTVNFVSGTIAAVAATLITQPADVVRTRIQLGLTQAAAQGGGVAAAAAAGTAAAAAAGGAGPRLASVQLLRQIAASQGARGLLAGAAPRVVKRTLQTALVWTLYEELYPRLQRAGDWAAQRLKAES